MVGLPPSGCRINTRKTQASKIQLIDRDIDDPDRIVIRDVVVEHRRKQGALGPAFALDKMLQLDCLIIYV